jgi:spore coat polysaccharide biosynthesis protein SpsF (cytidylyltransferase family)
MDRLAVSPFAREHVTNVARTERADAFLMRTVCDDQDNSDLRWTVDTNEDLLLMRTLYEELNLADGTVPYTEVVAHVRRNPRLSQINAHVGTFTG